jgi:hypothetical protein
VIPTGRLGLPVERDRHRTAAHPLSAYATASKERLVDRLQGRCMQAAVWTAARSRTFATQLFRLMPSRLAAETAARCNGGSTRTTNWPENGFSGPELLPGNMVTDGGATFGRHERDAGSRERKPAVPSDGLTNQPILPSCTKVANMPRSRSPSRLEWSTCAITAQSSWVFCGATIKVNQRRIVDGDEALEVSGGFERLHDPLSPPRRQVHVTRISELDIRTIF